MQRSVFNEALKLDLTENTPDSSSSSRLPNLVEHAENVQARQSPATASNRNENLSSELPNVVQGSMDYDAESRSPLYLNYDTNEYNQETVAHGESYVERGYRGYQKTTAYDTTYDNSRIYPEDKLRFNPRVEQRTYQELDLDVPYDWTDTIRHRNYKKEQERQNNSNNPTHKELEGLKYDSKKDLKQSSTLPNASIASNGYDSGVKTHGLSYDLVSSDVELISKKNKNKRSNSPSEMYGTLPRYESSGAKGYDYEDSQRSVYDDGYHGSKYHLRSSKSYERGKYDAMPRGRDKSYEQTLKIGDSGSSLSAYERKEVVEGEKMNGYKKNNCEAFGVYSDLEDDHGFMSAKKTPHHTYKGVVVNVSGESSVVEQNMKESRSRMDMRSNPWCRPTILLLLLVLLVVIFVFIAGVLLYFDCKYTQFYRN